MNESVVSTRVDNCAGPEAETNVYVLVGAAERKNADQRVHREVNKPNRGRLEDTTRKGERGGEGQAGAPTPTYISEDGWVDGLAGGGEGMDSPDHDRGQLHRICGMGASASMLCTCTTSMPATAVDRRARKGGGGALSSASS